MIRPPHRSPGRLALLASLLVLFAACDDGPRTAICDPDTALDTRSDEVNSAPPVDTIAATDTSAPDAPDASDTSGTDGDAPQPPICPWQPLDDGLVGGLVQIVQFHPNVPNVAFATSDRTLYRSLDNGRTWDRFGDTGAGFTGLAFPADAPKRVLGIGGDGVYDSTDSGASFAPLALTGLEATAILVHPALPQRVFIGTFGAGILRSNNEGAGFAPHNVGVPRSRVTGLVGDPSDENVVVASLILQDDQLGWTNDGAIIRSVDGGRHWTTVLSDIRRAHVLAACPSDASRIYAGTLQGAFRSSDGGVTWARADAIPTNGWVTAIGVAPNDCDRVYVSVFQAGIYRSADGLGTAVGPLVDGLTLEPSRLRALSLAVDPADADHVLAATHAGIFATDDGGETWSLIDVARSMTPVRLTGSTEGGGPLWLATYGSGLWSRAGVAEPWIRDTALPRDYFYSVTTRPDDPATIFAGSLDALWRSTDGGLAWDKLAVSGNIFDVAFLSDPDELLVATQTGGIQRSSDNGDTWAPSNGDLTPWPTVAGTFIDTRTILVDPDDPRRLLVGTNRAGVIRSDDRGVTWAASAPTLATEWVVDLEQDTATGHVYAMALERGVFYSDDWGASWTRATTGLDSVTLNDLAVDSATGFLYVAPAGLAIHYSADEGETWLPFDRYCLPDPAEGFATIAIVTLDDGRYLVAARGGNEVWRHALD